MKNVLAVFLSVLMAACQATAPIDLAGLATQPALHYSVLVSGGAFVEPTPNPDLNDPLSRTFLLPAGEREAIALETLVAALQKARTFVAIGMDPSGSQERDVVAGQREAVLGSLGKELGLRAVLDSARQQGHDYVLVIEKLQDGPIESHGVNGLWPVTSFLWLLIGLGFVIPDHGYESLATLHVSVRDVHTGSRVYQTVLSGGLVELSLLSRSSFWGFVLSILVPPSLVSSDDSIVLESVRAVAIERLLFSLARDLKSIACQQQLLAGAPAQIALSVTDKGLELDVTALDSLTIARFVADGTAIDDPAVDAFELEFLGSEKVVDGRYSYRAIVPGEVHAGRRRVQVLVQTVTGRVASSTTDLRDL